MLIDPQEYECPLPGGGTKTFILSTFPAVQGREIVTGYPTSNVPKLGSYNVSEELMLKLMCFVAVPIEGKEPLQLTTKALVNNHVPDWETLARLEMKMLERNCSFFKDGRALTLFQGIAQAVQQLTTKTLMDLLPQLLEAVKQRSTN